MKIHPAPILLFLKKGVFSSMKKIILITMLLILLTSCSEAEIAKDELEQTTETEYTYQVICTLPAPPPSYYFYIEDVVIIEWGDVVDLNIYDDGSGKAGQYKGVGVKYIKNFESTASNLGNKSLNMPNRRYSFIDADIRKDFVNSHDDILLVKAECATRIIKGDTVLTHIDRFYSKRLPINSYTDVGFFEIYGNEARGELEIIPIVDGKIQLPESFFKGNFVLDHALLECNDKLTQLGLTDNLFRDGMTIEELDDYFDLVTNKDTFAPLFNTQ